MVGTVVGVVVSGVLIALDVVVTVSRGSGGSGGTIREQSSTHVHTSKLVYSDCFNHKICHLSGCDFELRDREDLVV